MFRSLAKFSIACVVAMSMAGCAANTSSTEEEDIQTAQQALLGKPGVATIYAQALVDPVTGETVIDLTTAPSFNLPSDVLHSADQFHAVAIFKVTGGRTRVLGVFGGANIGPGGGCIHFHDLAFNVGDKLRIGAVVDYADGKTTVAATAVIEANYINPPTNVPAPHFGE